MYEDNGVRIRSMSERSRVEDRDELLTSLADAQENRRARQAYEWEVVRRKAERRAAARVGTYV